MLRDADTNRIGEDSEIEQHLGLLPLPGKHAVPEQIFVTWTVSALLTLQLAGLSDRFDLDGFAASYCRL
jgi:hypothetical protein